MKRLSWAGYSVSFVIIIANFTLPLSLAQDTPAVSLADPNIFVKLSKTVVPSVVNISTAKLIRSPYVQGQPDDIFRKFFEDFFGPGGFPGGPGFAPGKPHSQRKSPKSKMVQRPLSLGTGFIVDASGLILTNNHVVADADEIKVNFTENPDEKPTDGEVVGRDVELDVALIRVKGKPNLVPLMLGDSDSLDVGEYVVAVGNPFGQGHSVTHGIISAKERTVPGLGGGLSHYLQTDAPINPGNSGGPLINLKGEVIGINNAIDARAQGIGFAIPISLVKKILPQLRNKGSVDRGYLGAVIGELNPQLAEKLGVERDLRAPFVTSVEPGGPADRAGIKPYDILLSVNDKSLHSAANLVGTVTAIPVGEKAKVNLIRDGKEQQVFVKIGRRPGGETEIHKKSSKPSADIEIGASLESASPGLARRFGLPQDAAGAIVTEVDEGGPAAQAGISVGDLILEVDRKSVRDVKQFYDHVRENKSYLLRIQKGGEEDMRSVFSIVVLDLKKK